MEFWGVNFGRRVFCTNERLEKWEFLECGSLVSLLPLSWREACFARIPSAQQAAPNQSARKLADSKYATVFLIMKQLRLHGWTGIAAKKRAPERLLHPGGTCAPCASPLL